ncbi:MAG: hypothetical protein ACOY0T_16280 [Myxococcota bacterium]
MTPEDIDQRLARLSRETEAIRARVGLSELVLTSVAARTSVTFQYGLMRHARRAVSIAALLALAVLGLALTSQRSANLAMAADFGATGVDW